MLAVDTADLIPVLQTAVGPVILVSGVGLLLLTMTNRFGRVVDRSRALAHQLRNSPGQQADTLRAQLRVNAKRARLIRLSIGLASSSVLLAAVLVIVLFARALFDFEVVWLITLLFTSCMGCVVASLVAFIMDVNMSLHALRDEIGEDWKP
jgi:hypothetical protein